MKKCISFGYLFLIKENLYFNEQFIIITRQIHYQQPNAFRTRNRQQMQTSTMPSRMPSQADDKKYQYHTGAPNITSSGLSTSTLDRHRNSTGMSASTIDQHRNSIEQRIANLEAKLSQKYHTDVNVNSSLHTQSENYIPSQAIKQYPYPNQVQPYPPGSNSYVESINTKYTESLSQSETKQQFISNDKYNRYNYFNNPKPLDQPVLREQPQFSSDVNKYNQVGKSASNFIPSSKTSLNQNNHFNYQQIAQRNQKSIVNELSMKVRSNSKHSLKQQENHNLEKLNQKNTTESTLNQIKKQPHLQNHQQTGRYPLTSNLQQQINQLNQNISNLKADTGVFHPTYQKKQINDSQHSKAKNVPLNIQGSDQNSELYQMMKTILMGQQRLEKQLLILKSKQCETKQIKNLLQTENKAQQNFNSLQVSERQKKNSAYLNLNSQKHKLKSKQVIQSLAKSPLNTKTKDRSMKKEEKQNRSSISPVGNQRSKSPHIFNDPNKKSATNKKDNSLIKRRYTSAMQQKKAGKITKNKDEFYELYKQAQTNKRISPLNTRVTISSEAISTVWEKIRSVIQRSESQDAETSKIFHQNKRYVNDHLVNTIELQKKLKGDLVKKVYEMCENKCLFK